MARFIMAVACVVALAAPAAAQDKPTIQKLNDQFMAAFGRGDVAAIAAMYADDAYILPAGGDMVKGRAEIEKFWRDTLQQVADFKLTTVDVLPLGAEAAREIGTFSLKTKAQPPAEVVGKYVVVWRKTGADWQLATDIWNTNK